MDEQENNEARPADDLPEAQPEPEPESISEPQKKKARRKYRKEGKYKQPKRVKPASLQVKQARFLRHYEQTGSILRAARLAKISPSSHYNWMRESDEYREKFETATEWAIDVLEQEARRRAVEGVEKPIFYKGQKIATVREHSDTLLIFLLKGLKPETYRENVKVQAEVNQHVSIEEKWASPDQILANVAADFNRLIAAKGITGGNEEMVIDVGEQTPPTIEANGHGSNGELNGHDGPGNNGNGNGHV